MASTGIQVYFTGISPLFTKSSENGYSINAINSVQPVSSSSVNQQYRLRLPSLTAKKFNEFPNRTQTGYCLETTGPITKRNTIPYNNSKSPASISTTTKSGSGDETQLPECTVIRETLRTRNNSFIHEPEEPKLEVSQRGSNPQHQNDIGRTNHRIRTIVFRENVRKRRKLKKVRSAVARVCETITWSSAENSGNSNDSSSNSSNSYERVHRSSTIQLHSALNGAARRQMSVPDFQSENSKLELVGASIYCNAPPNSALHQHPPASDREKGGSSEEHNGGTPLTSRRKNTGNVLVSPNRDHLDTRCDDLIALGKVAAMKSEPNPSSHVGGQLTSRSRSQTGAVTGGQQMMQMPLNGYLPKSSMNPTLSRMKSTMSKPQNGLSSFAAMSQSAAANNSSNSSAKNGVSNKGTISSRVSGGDYADPVSGAQNSFQLRLQEMVVLEGETIKYERQRKLGRRRLKFD